MPGDSLTDEEMAQLESVMAGRAAPPTASAGLTDAQIAAIEQKQDPSMLESAASGVLSTIGSTIDLGEAAASYLFNPMSAGLELQDQNQLHPGDLFRSLSDTVSGREKSTEIGEGTWARKFGEFLPWFLPGKKIKTVKEAVSAIPSVFGKTAITSTGAQAGEEVGGPVGEFVGATLTAPIPTLAKKGASVARNVLRSVFSTPAKEAAAENMARDIVRQYVNPDVALPGLEKAAAEDAAAPYITRQQETYLPQYTRTAERAGDTGTATLEAAVSKLLPKEAEPIIAAQDTAREAARQKLFQVTGPTEVGAEDIGANFRTAAEAERQALSDKITESARKAFKPGSETIPSYPAKVSLSNTITQLTRGRPNRLSKDFRTLVKDFRALPPRTDLDALQGFREEFGQYLNPAHDAKPIVKRTAKAAANVRAVIDSTVEEMAAAGKIPKGQYKAWQKMLEQRRELGRTFQSKQVGKGLQKSFGEYEAEGSLLGERLTGTVEAARQSQAAIGKNAAAKNALRAQVWWKNIYQSPGVVTPTGEFNTASFIRAVNRERNVAEVLLTPSQQRVLDIIGSDLKQQGGVSKRAYRASKGGPFTAQQNTVIDAIKSSVGEKVAGAFATAHPTAGGMLSIVRRMIVNPTKRTELINQALARFVTDPEFAIKLLKPPTPKNVQAVMVPLMQNIARATLASTSTDFAEKEKHYRPNETQPGEIVNPFARSVFSPRGQ